MTAPELYVKDLVHWRKEISTAKKFLATEATFIQSAEGGIIADVETLKQAREMVARMRAGDLRSLARAISIIEDHGSGSAELLAICAESAGTAVRIGITGPPGAGKSTLVDQMARALRLKGTTVGIVAVDPSSPYTGGALLGDRIRMQGFTGDDGVYVRSMASRGALGGLAHGAAQVCSVLEAAGRQTILIETVGVGQDEVEVIRLADLTVLVLVPGMGDDVQSLKAGVMEVADIFVVNKSDREGADRVEQEILAMQGLAASHGDSIPPIVRTVGLTGEGIDALMVAIDHVLDAKRNTATSAPLHLARRPNEFPTLDHLGIAVRSIVSARGFYQALGIPIGAEETVEHEQVRVAMLPLGDSRIELLEATAEDSVIGRFITRRGEGLHHIALRVADVDAQFARMKAEGVRLASDAVRVGAGGHRYFFVHPAATGGVLVEILSAKERAG